MEDKSAPVAIEIEIGATMMTTIISCLRREIILLEKNESRIIVHGRNGNGNNEEYRKDKIKDIEKILESIALNGHARAYKMIVKPIWDPFLRTPNPKDDPYGQTFKQ